MEGENALFSSKDKKKTKGLENVLFSKNGRKNALFSSERHKNKILALIKISLHN